MRLKKLEIGFILSLIFWGNNMFDAYKIRKDFPILDRLIEGKRNTYLDTAASAQKPFVMLEEIRKELNFTTLKYHRLDDLTASIDIEPCKLCTYCWSGKE